MTANSQVAGSRGDCAPSLQGRVNTMQHKSGLELSRSWTRDAQTMQDYASCSDELGSWE